MVMVNKSILGKKKQSSVFVVTGNKNGVIGYGFGKGPASSGAMRLARIHASQRLLYIDRYEDRTLFHNFYEEFYFTKVYAEKMPAGYGLKCHRIIKLICDLVGIKDLYAKVEGSRNPKNIAKAFISGLLNSVNIRLARETTAFLGSYLFWKITRKNMLTLPMRKIFMWSNSSLNASLSRQFWRVPFNLRLSKVTKAPVTKLDRLHCRNTIQTWICICSKIALERRKNSSSPSIPNIRRIKNTVKKSKK